MASGASGYLPAPAAVVPEEQPETGIGVSKLSDGLSTPFRSKVLPQWRPEFEDRHVHREHGVQAGTALMFGRYSAFSRYEFLGAEDAGSRQ